MSASFSAVDLRAWLESNPSKSERSQASLVTWLELLRDYPDLWWAAANRPELPSELLPVLALSRDDRVRWRIALRNKVPQSVRELFTSDPDETVRTENARKGGFPDPDR